MRLYPAFVLATSSLLFACGGSAPPATGAGDHHQHGEGHEHGEGHDHAEKHAKLSGPLKDFHEVLKPLWHAEKGPARLEKVCAESKTLQEKADATQDAELVSAVKALGDECAKEGRPELEARFVAVHDRFHALAK